MHVTGITIRPGRFAADHPQRGAYRPRGATASVL